MTNCPWLSVIIPTYNGQHVLPAALSGIEAQAERDFEVIVIDDDSTDGTKDILKAFSERTKLPLTIVDHGHTGNWVANSNHGLSLARGDWACFLHQDDGWAPDRLATLKNHIDGHPQAGFFLHPSWYVDRRGRRLGLWSCPLPATEVTSETMCERLLVQNFISMPAPLFRRSVALKVGGLDASLWYTADWDFWLKLARQGNVVYIASPLSFFGLHSESQTIRRSTDLIEFQDQLTRVFERHFKEWKFSPSRGQALRKLGEFSIAFNSALAGWLKGIKPDYLLLFRQFLSMGPRGWHYYLRDSRIFERVMARLRAGMASNLSARQVDQ
jgi:glycosyltransferase involved in cell wall biosynthesis